LDPLVLLGVGALVVLVSILVLRLHAFVALLLGALLVASLTPATSLRQYAASQELSAEATEEFVSRSIGERLVAGFGSTCAEVGLLIALASIIGKALLDSGAADRIVRSMLRVLGEARASLAFLASGFVLGIPVFFDTVFYLLLPLGKAMATRNERNYLLYILSIVAGATMTHSLVPPTPGPLVVAGMLNVGIGTMMLGGAIVGIFAVAAGYGYALWANRRWPIPLRDSADLSLAELQSLAAKDPRHLPPFWLAALPIVLPVVLIASSAIAAKTLSAGNGVVRVLSEVGDKNIALAIGAAVAVVMWASYRRATAKEFAADMQ
jgi:GntP family gluconate:H+ symporter